MLKIFKRSTLAAISAMVLTCNTALASQGGLGLHLGYGDHYRRMALVYETPSFWQVEFGSGSGRVDAVGELAVAHWSANSALHPGYVWQVSATPFLRWWMGDSVFIEAGIGANVFSRTRFANKNMSTAFQFGDHIGVTWQINQNNRLGLRYSHFSNASIKRPNPGLNILQLRYGYQF